MTTFNPAVITHGDGRTYTGCLLIGKAPDQSTFHYIVEIFPTSMKFINNNPILATALPDLANTGEVTTIMLNLRRNKKTVLVEGFVYDTNLDTLSFGTDNSFIEDGASEGLVFNTTNGAITIPAPGSNFDRINIKSAIKKKWMLERLADAGTTSGGAALTLQWRGISDPGGTDERENIYHEKVTLSNLQPTDTETGVKIVSSVQEVKKIKVTFTLTWGDPTA